MSARHMQPILQFGTSRFLQAHADLFIDEALARGEALGRITVVQSTANPQSARRLDAFRSGDGYPVRIRGLQQGVAVDREQRVHAIAAALHADEQWPAIVEQAAGPARVIISNTADQGYALDRADHPGLLNGSAAPRSFPAKLLVLLHHRYRRGAGPITLLPCELVANNGRVLRDLVLGLAHEWELDQGFIAWLDGGCVWVNSLVDRIVSEAIEPAGAVAEPYALWAIERQAGMLLPCSHPRMVLTDDLEPYERRKLFLLNLGHSLLAEHWRRAGRPAGDTVRAALADPDMARELDTVWRDEVLPVLDALGDTEARAYLVQVRERFANPYLEHRLADIARHHEEKLRRRMLPVVALAARLQLRLRQPRLRAALQLNHAGDLPSLT